MDDLSSRFDVSSPETQKNDFRSMANQYKSLNQAISERADLDIIKEMLSNGADIHERNKDHANETPLHNAAWFGSTELINLLIESGADIFSRDDCGQTPLHYAVAAEEIDIAKLLIALGADVDDTYNSGANALGVICLGDDRPVEMCNMLLAAGADPRNKDGGGATDLQNNYDISEKYYDSSWEDLKELTSICLKQGLDINDRNDKGNTPILQYYANSVEDEFEMEARVIKLLIDNGADVTMTSEQDGHSLLDHVNNGDIEDKEVCELILKAANK